MLQYYGTRLSDNLSRREPEGYLLCLNVPVARTGTQEYLPGELGLTNAEPPAGGNELIPVYRPEEEVFAPETMASFEGMPVTNDHPPDGVDVSNIRALQKGHAHNVRRGSGEESDLLLADLIITDPALITAILEEGKREISCGYTYELCMEKGQYIQRKIRGNHVAVVDAGRAGSRVSIKDRKPVVERRKSVMKKSLSKVLARMAKDGDIETVAGIIEEMIDPAETETEAAPAVSESTVVVEPPAEEPVEEPQEETKNIIIDEGGLTGVLERLDRIIVLLEAGGLTAAADEDAGEAVSEALEEGMNVIGSREAGATATLLPADHLFPCGDVAALARLLRAAAEGKLALDESVRETADPAAEEIAAVMEEILDPVASVILEQDEPENDLPETLQTGDALRAALTAVKPVLARMPGGMRKKVAGDIAARLRRAGDNRAEKSGVYAALASAQRRTAPVSADL